MMNEICLCDSDPTAHAAADPWQTHAVVISAIEQEIDGVATYDLTFCDEAARSAFRYAPGQFNMLYLPVPAK